MNGWFKANYKMLASLSEVTSFWLKLACDVGSLALAWWFTYWLCYHVLHWQWAEITTEKWPITFVTAGITYYLVFKYNRLYEPRHFLSGSGDPLALFKACVVGFIFTFFILYNFRMFYISRKFTLLFFLISLILIHVFRFIIRRLGRMIRKWGLGNRRVLIIGDNDISQGLWRRLFAHPEEGWIPLGIVPVTDDVPPDDGIKRYKHPDRLREYVTQGAVDEAIICLPDGQPPEIFKYFKQMAGLPLTIRVLSKHLHILWDKLPMYIEEYRDLPVIVFGGGRKSLWRLVVKRLFDIVFSFMVLVIGSPLWLVIAHKIKKEDKGPALFLQERVKKLGKHFKLYKFRTMIVDAEKLKKKLAEQSFMDGPMFKIKDDPRITEIGKTLRKLSLDEIPQFINVFKGEMSLVGPRPPLPDEVADYEEWHKYRIEGWVGLTGLWQICGRNQLQFEEVVLFDVFYLHNFSLFLDIQIIFLTVGVVLSPKGSY